MDMEEHKTRHEILHKHLDELVADYIRHTEGLPSRTTIIDLIKWSSGQVLNPTDDGSGS